MPEALVEWIISKNLRMHNNIADYYINTVQASVKELETINLAIKKYNQCLAYCQQNGEDLAIIQLKQVVASHPSFLKAHQLLALLYLHTGQYTRARQMIRQARKLDTGNEITLKYMHELTHQRGKQRRRSEKKKEDAVEYSLGNETIIQAETFQGERNGKPSCGGKCVYRRCDRRCDHMVSGGACGKPVAE